MISPAPFPVLNSEIHFLESKTNQIRYQLSITKPFSYHEEADKEYPCLVVLDPLILQVLVAGILQHLYFSDFPEILLVGIGPISPQRIENFAGWLPEAYSFRQRDYTPSVCKKTAESINEWFGRDLEQGKASDFLNILENELKPFVIDNYRIKKNDISIMGHSLGGLFTLYTLFTDPKLFRGYAALSPALYFDNRIVFDLEEELFKETQELNADLYMTVGMEENEFEYCMVSNVLRLAETLKIREYKGLNIKRKIFENVDHNEVVPLASLGGLIFLYKHA